MERSRGTKGKLRDTQQKKPRTRDKRETRKQTTKAPNLSCLKTETQKSTVATTRQESSKTSLKLGTPNPTTGKTTRNWLKTLKVELQRETLKGQNPGKSGEPRATRRRKGRDTKENP
jgi:hypothetical protein